MAKNHRPVIVNRTEKEWLGADTEKLQKHEIAHNTDTGEMRHGPGTWAGLTPDGGKECATALVRVASTANVTIASGLNAGDTIDGVELDAGDLVLLKNQSTASQNGIYQVGASPARAASFNTWAEHLNALVRVDEGSTNGGKYFRCSVSAGGTLDTTDMTFVAADQRGALKLATRSQVAGLPAGSSSESGAALLLLERADGTLVGLSLTNLKASLALLP